MRSADKKSHQVQTKSHNTATHEHLLVKSSSVQLLKEKNFKYVNSNFEMLKDIACESYEYGKDLRT